MVVFKENYLYKKREQYWYGNEDDLLVHSIYTLYSLGVGIYSLPAYLAFANLHTDPEKPLGKDLFND